MKINRFVAMAAIALLVVGTMGAVVSRSLALTSHSQGTSISSAQSDACAQDQADDTEAVSAADTDNVELQCGDQNAPDNEQETVSAADTDNDQVEEQVGNQSEPDTGMEAPEPEVPVTP